MLTINEKIFCLKMRTLDYKAWKTREDNKNKYFLVKEINHNLGSTVEHYPILKREYDYFLSIGGTEK